MKIKKNNGISHFLEHLFFKGTKKRPNKLAISKVMDEIGGEFNASTGREKTNFYTKTAADKIDIGFDLLSDILCNSLFRKEDIEKEKGVIIEEINMYKDDPEAKAGLILEKIMWPISPLGFNIAGEKKVIRELSRDSFLSYLKDLYKPNNMVVSIAGKFNKKKVLNLTKRYFGKLKKDKVKSFKRARIVQEKPKASVFYKKTEQSHICFGLHGYHARDKRKYALSLMNIILGGGMSSRLFQEVREKRGLCYSISSSAVFFLDTGALVIEAGVDNKRVFEACEVILCELDKLGKRQVSAEELKRAKEYFKGKTILAMEESNEVAQYVAGQLLSTGKILTLSQLFKKIDKVTEDDIQNVSSDIFKDSKLNLSLVGPFRKNRKFYDIIKMQADS